MTAARAAANVELLQQYLEVRLIRFSNADEEQDAAAVPRATLREEQQPLMAAAPPQIAAQDRFSVRDSAAHRADANDFRNGQGGPLHPHARVPELGEVRLELAAEVQTCNRFSHWSPVCAVSRGRLHGVRQRLTAEILCADPPLAAVGGSTNLVHQTFA